MNCLHPNVLKNGLVVPCGKCDLCRSDIRNEWSIRLAIHLSFCDKMPMFITLTYDDYHLPYRCIDVNTQELYTFSCKDFDENPEYSGWCSALYPTLHRYHVSRFLKAYKRKFGLDNETFQYFGCGEYGERTRRPHYHLLFFGDSELYSSYFENTEDATTRLQTCWKHGFVHVGVAGFDGMHYVTKYCLKDDIANIPELAVKPFTIASNGLGTRFVKTPLGERMKADLVRFHKNQDKIISNMPIISEDDLSSLKDAIDYLQSHLPNFEVILDDGRKVFLPRAIRRLLVGSFEHFKDSPLWLLNSLRTLKDSMDYYKNYRDYDNSHEMNMSYIRCLNRLEKIQKRLLERKYNKSNLAI